MGTSARGVVAAFPALPLAALVLQSGTGVATTPTGERTRSA
ncbi:hypothetical protein [Nocardioides campestrisoli]|nr:hypothetical protein [Nocardioides campestrisoli]